MQGSLDSLWGIRLQTLPLPIFYLLLFYPLFRFGLLAVLFSFIISASSISINGDKQSSNAKFGDRSDGIQTNIPKYILTVISIENKNT